MMIRKFALVLLMIALLPVAERAHAQGGAGSLTVDGVERTFEVYVPSSYDGAQPIPLVIALHPYGSSGKAMELLTGFDALAEQDGFIVAYPDSFDLAWDDGKLASGWPSKLQPSDDVGFISALIDHLAATYTIDPQRVYLTGFATGGGMAYRLACEIPDRLAKVAVVNALLWDYHVAACGAESARPLPMLILQGAANVDNPVGGLTLTPDDTGRAWKIFSADETAAFWAKRSGCNPEVARTLTTPTATIYDTCPHNARVALYIFSGVANNWPRVGPYVLNQFGIDATEIVAQYFTSQNGPVIDRDADPDVAGGVARSYVVYVPPAYDPAAPMPVVVALHGRSGTGPSMAYLLDFNRVAREKGFIAVYPDGMPFEPNSYGREWNVTGGLPGYAIGKVDDVAFLSRLIDDLAVDLNIDQTRLYMLGFSNGGFMAQRMACEAGDRWAAFASVSATIFNGLPERCQGRSPIPMLLIHGTRDTIVPWDGTVYGNQVIWPSVLDTVSFWGTHDDCDVNTLDHVLLASNEQSPTTRAHVYTLGGCADSSKVILIAIEGGGHNLPGIPDRIDPRIAGAVNTDINAGEVIWGFFAQYTRQ
jgi:polyhydroxybutyrate depolymerase